MRSGDPTQPPDDTTLPTGAHAGAAAGGSVGRFRVDGMLGRGGMGIVLDAYDPELGRPVAVKLLRSDVWGESRDVDRARLQREAQAMAKLSHPNVVTVYEVGEVDGQSFLAMEKVDGVTLRVWQEGKRKAAEVIAMYVAVGRGLAAAHEAGLVHRDFKPENVLVGRDGRARVGDFGLVSGGVVIGSTDAAGLAVGENLTVRGSTMGTPAYMAPEQWAGEDTDARTDQFAFAVALWEALYGERPFAGKDVPSIRAAVLAGERRPPPRGARAPSWMFPILVRALERQPDRRWPTLAAMLDELERRSRPARVPMLAAGGLAAAATGAIVIAIAATSPAGEDPCPRPALDGVWDAAAQARLREHLRKLDPARGEAIFTDLARFADRHARAWQDMRVETCTQARTGAQSPARHDRRMACLTDRLDQLGQTAARTQEVADPAKLEDVLAAWRGLSPVADCADDAIIGSFAPPPGPAQRAEAAAIAEGLRTVEVDRRLGKLDGLAERAAPLLARARAVDHAPLVASALHALARIAQARVEVPAAVAHLDEAILAAARAGDDALAATIWTTRARLLAVDLGKPADALAQVPSVRAWVARAGDRLSDRVALLLAEAQILSKLTRQDEALVRANEARALLEAAGAATPGSPLRLELAGVLDEAGDVMLAGSKPEHREEAIAVYRAAIAILTEELGAEHPDVAAPLLGLGEALRRQSRLDDAKQATAEAVRIREARLGDSPALAQALGYHANILRERGEEVESLALVERSLAMMRATASEWNPIRFQVLNTAAIAYMLDQEDDRARAVLDEGIALGERLGVVNTNRAVMLINVGNLDVKIGDCAAALPRFRRSVELYEQFLDEDVPQILVPLRRIGQCQLATGDLAGALASLDRALALDAPPAMDLEILVARRMKGEALVRTGDVAGGCALLAAVVRDATARDAAGAKGPRAMKQMERLDTWFEEHAPPGPARCPR